METVNLVATFAEPSDAEAAARLVEREVDDARISVDAPGDERDSLRGEMGDEVRAATMGPGSVGPFTKSQTRGVLRGVVVAVPVGMALGAIGGLLFTPGDVSLGARVLIGLAAGAFAGGTLGLLWGALQPRFEGEGAELAAERGVVLGVHDLSLEHARTLSERLADLGPERIDVSDGRGGLVASWSAEDERPLRGEHVASKPPGDGFEGTDPGSEGPTET